MAALVIFLIVALLVGLVVMLLRDSSGPTDAAGSEDSEDVASTSTPEGVRTLRAEQELKQAYIELRSRPGLAHVQAIWSGDYGEIEQYFEEESRWLRQHPDVQMERIVIARPEQAKFLGRLADSHENLQLFKGTVPSLQFELYLCQYMAPRRTLAGILVLIHPLSRVPEFGILFDGQAESGVEPFIYALREWFENIPRQPIEGKSGRSNVWTRNASKYDNYVKRHSEHPFLAAFIQQEDAILEDLIRRSAREVCLVEFGAGTGRTLRYLASKEDLASKVPYFIGFDRSSGMVEESRRKRNTLRRTSHKVYFFELDGAKAARHFWNGYFDWGMPLNDARHLGAHPIDKDRYHRSGKIFTCLLNTLGVVDEGTRFELVKEMMIAAGPGDQVVISVFNAQAFPKHAKPLYSYIKELVGTDESNWQFDDDTAEFRAGYYYSYWFSLDELEELVRAVGGTTEDVQAIECEDEVIGHVLTCRKTPVQAGDV